MRLVKNIPHEKFYISLFALGDKYLLQLEAGPMIQGYKVPQDQMKGGEGFEAMLDEQWFEEIYAHFTAMFQSFQAALTRAEGPLPRA